MGADTRQQTRRRGIVIVVVIVAAVVMLAPQLAGISRPAQNGQGPAAQPTPPQYPNGLPLQASAKPDQVDFPWALDHIDESTERIYFRSESFRCAYPDGATATVDAGTITVRVLGTPRAQSCASDLVNFPGYIQLDKPVAGKKIVKPVAPSP